MFATDRRGILGHFIGCLHTGTGQKSQPALDKGSRIPVEGLCDSSHLAPEFLEAAWNPGRIAIPLIITGRSICARTQASRLSGPIEQISTSVSTLAPTFDPTHGRYHSNQR
jgi:hypothetical protein